MRPPQMFQVGDLVYAQTDVKDQENKSFYHEEGPFRVNSIRPSADEQDGYILHIDGHTHGFFQWRFSHAETRLSDDALEEALACQDAYNEITK